MDSAFDAISATVGIGLVCKRVGIVNHWDTAHCVPTVSLRYGGHASEAVGRLCGRFVLSTTDGDVVDLDMGLAYGDVNSAADRAAEACGQAQVFGTHGNLVHNFLRFTD